MALQNDLTLDESAPTKCELKCSEERFGYWLDRFESWRRAIDRTFWLYLERKGAISKYRDPKEREAARMGTIHRLWVDALPAPLLGFFAAELRKRSARDSEIFHKHAASVQKVRWDFPELDLWLIEVWPLVVGHNWTYEDTWRIACEKFHPSMEELKGKKKALDTAEAFSNHCKMKSLNLRLSPEAQKRGGRPKGGISTQSKLALGAELALEIDGFQWPGENKTSEKLRCVRLSLEGLITVDQVDPTLTG